MYLSLTEMKLRQTHLRDFFGLG